MVQQQHIYFSQWNLRGIRPSSPDQKKHKSIKQTTEDLYFVISKYLWLHGLGFENDFECTAKSFLTTAISLLLSILVEGNLVITLYLSIHVLKSNNIGIKNYLFILFPFLFYGSIRLLFYYKRKKFKKHLRDLAEMYAKVGKNEESVKKFRVKLTCMLFLNDLFQYSYAAYYMFIDTQDLDKLFKNISLPISLAIAFYFFCHFTYNFGYVHAAVTAYFSSICFVLKESLAALNERLQGDNAEEELEALAKIHCEISDLITATNHFLHPHLITAFPFLLCRVFQQSYSAIFMDENRYIIFRTFNIFLLFSHFACMCLFGLSVINTASKVKFTVQNLSIKISHPRYLHFIDTMKDSMEGFKILSSTIIDSNLILSALANLITYGIIVATFDLNNS